jgi:hypothetical protein
MKKLFISLLLIIPFSLCRAQNQNGIQQTDYHIHKGFFLSLSGGPNFSGISDKVSGQFNMKYTGTGPVLDLKIGGTLKENLILHGTITTNYISGPEITSNEESYNTSDNLMVGEDFIGGGITYYFMPSNILLSGSIGLGKFLVMNTDDDTSISSDQGFGFQLKVGKEWWISRRWGLGVAISYSKLNVRNTPGGGVVELMNSNNFGIHFNATLN